MQWVLYKHHQEIPLVAKAGGSSSYTNDANLTSNTICGVRDCDCTASPQVASCKIKCTSSNSTLSHRSLSGVVLCYIGFSGISIKALKCRTDRSSI